MLAMMGMLALLYEQVGDRQEAQPLLALLNQEWNRTPELCSGFVPWALARAAGNGTMQGSSGAETLFFRAAERFRMKVSPSGQGLFFWIACFLILFSSAPRIGSF